MHHKGDHRKHDGEAVGILTPARLLLEHSWLFSELPEGKPVLDLACGEDLNGIYLATKGIRITLAGRSEDALTKARLLADPRGAVSQIVCRKTD